MPERPPFFVRSLVLQPQYRAVAASCWRWLGRFDRLDLRRFGLRRGLWHPHRFRSFGDRHWCGRCDGRLGGR